MDVCLCLIVLLIFFFFKQKTAYEMRISDWSSDVCSSDLAAQCLDRVGLADLAGTRASALSYGDQRRLEIARALASDPTLLILDEPAAGMNHVEEIGRASCRERVCQYV